MALREPASLLLLVTLMVINANSTTSSTDPTSSATATITADTASSIISTATSAITPTTSAITPIATSIITSTATSTITSTIAFTGTSAITPTASAITPIATSIITSTATSTITSTVAFTGTSAITPTASAITPTVTSTITSPQTSASLNGTISNAGTSTAYNEQCSFTHDSFLSTNTFQIQVSPGVLTSNSNFTVKVTGSGIVQVIVQAVWNNTFVGKWLEQAGSTYDPSCHGIFFSNISLQANQPLIATWTSPNTLTSAEIRAIINNGSATFNVSQVLNQASNPVASSTATASTRSAVSKTSSSGSTRPLSSILFSVMLLVLSKSLLL